MKKEEKIEVEREQSDKMSTLDKIKQLLNKNQSLIEGALNDKRREKEKKRD